ncbi:TIGR03943 family putative permease subunit [Streptomyces poonensis]|uniref:Membrane protein n=1 Tax=Streptomyces poonensis TaxID=68255 RepID=A0A918PBK4_9ACTN|nr:TIGR03943 family protein [Streptomyces poonensis]GGY97775.1 membrane protein [Streptomyces poonensis]
MRRPLQAALLALSGLGLLHTALFTDQFLRYVKEGMRPLLIASGVVLLALGLAEAWTSYREIRRTADGEHDENDDGHGEHDELGGHDGHGEHDTHGEHGGHGEHSTPRVAWLLFLPALSLLFYAPPALGSYTAAREATKVVSEQEEFEPLPATSPLPITLSDFTRRVQQDERQYIKGRTVLMTGFVTPADDGDGGWYLTRLMLSCCAADAQSVKVRIHGGEPPKADTWVSVTGSWHSGGGGSLGTDSAEVALDARTVKRIDRPSNGYTDSLPLTAP